MRIVQSLYSLLFSLCTCLVLAAPAPLKDSDYQVLNPTQNTEAPAGKVELVAFVWYGCEHCNDMEPRLQNWLKTAPAWLEFRHEHAMWPGRSDVAGHAKLFVALKALGLVEKLSPKVFDAIHQQKIELRDEKVLFDWIAKQGVDRAQFEQVYKSFGSQTLFTRALQLTRDLKLSHVPIFIVNGKYLTYAGKVGSRERVFEVLDQLLAKAKAEAAAQ